MINFLKEIKSKDNLRYVRNIMIYTLVFIMCSNVFGTMYIFNEVSNKKNESSISVVAAPSFTFQSKAQVLMEPSTGKILYANNEDERLLPASVTKIMPLLLTMEAIDSGKLNYTDIITCSKKAAGLGGSQIWFEEGEKLTVEDALKAICVVSANDVTVAIAEHLSGSEENFVASMNAKAKELGMINTNFVNSHGIDAENHYTSAKDIAIMSRELVNKHPEILKYTSIWMDSIRDGKFGLSNTNKLVRFYEGTTGIKTGSTSKALFNLSASATRDGTTFIAVVLTAPTGDIRNAEVKQLLDYGFSNFKTKTIYKGGSIVDNITINKHLNNSLDVFIDEDISILFEKGKEIEHEEVIEYAVDLKAPISKGEVIGNIIITEKSGKEIIAKKDVIAKDDVEKSNLKDYYLHLIKKVFNFC